MTKEILNVKNISVTIDDTPILEHITFTVHEHEVLVILGPNGSGKTTLLKTLLGLVPHTGTITWHNNLLKNKRVSYLPPQELINKQYLLPLTVQEFLGLRDISEKAIELYMSEVGLDITLKNKQIRTLSTGQFQRMLIAWALSSNPQVLLFDEPTTGIDIGGEETVYNLLHTLWKEKKLTIILVTHHMHVVWEHATNVLCIHKKMVCHGTPEATLTKKMLESIYGRGAKAYEHRHHS